MIQNNKNAMVRKNQNVQLLIQYIVQITDNHTSFCG